LVTIATYVFITRAASLAFLSSRNATNLEMFTWVDVSKGLETLIVSASGGSVTALAPLAGTNS